MSKLLGREGASLDFAPAITDTLLFWHSIDLLYCREPKSMHRQQLCQEKIRMQCQEQIRIQHIMMFNNNLSRRWKRKRGAKLLMSDLDFVYYFEGHLYDTTHCGNQTCICLSILLLPGVVIAIASYLVFFMRKPKCQQDSILLDWIIYCISLPGSKLHFLCTI